MRFAAGRAPYKAEIYAIFDRGGYVNFSAAGLRAALGYQNAAQCAGLQAGGEAPPRDRCGTVIVPEPPVK
jgi:hypothetical protein